MPPTGKFFWLEAFFVKILDTKIYVRIFPEKINVSLLNNLSFVNIFNFSKRIVSDFFAKGGLLGCERWLFLV